MPRSAALVLLLASCVSPPPRVTWRCTPAPEADALFNRPGERWRGGDSRNARYYTYASKAHPELALEDNELVISTSATSQAPGDLLRDLRLYWPRFVRARLD